MIKPSTLRAHDLLRECYFDLNGFRKKYYGEGLFEDDLQVCVNLAEEVISQRPTQGYAWLVKATAERLRGDKLSAVNSLVTSQQVTSREAWLAPPRLELWLELADLLEDSQISGFGSDVRQALKFENGRQLAARGYVLHAELRPLLDEILSQVPPGQQNGTLSEIRWILESGQ